MEWYYVWWRWLTSKSVVQVCQHQLSFLSTTAVLPLSILHFDIYFCYMFSKITYLFTYYYLLVSVYHHWNFTKKIRNTSLLYHCGMSLTCVLSTDIVIYYMYSTNFQLELFHWLIFAISYLSSNTFLRKCCKNVTGFCMKNHSFSISLSAESTIFRVFQYQTARIHCWCWCQSVSVTKAL